MRTRCTSTTVPILLSVVLIIGTAVTMTVLVSKRPRSTGGQATVAGGPTDTTILQPAGGEGSTGSWQLLLENAGIASMHTAVTHEGNVVMLDRTNIGASRIELPGGRCRDSAVDLTLKHDCTAHSVVFTPGPNTVRPLFVQTDTWCSSGQFLADGTLVQTGGDFEGLYKVRRFRPCASGVGAACDWDESTTDFLRNGRWYATNQILPDGQTQIVVGGRNVFTYEFVPNPTGAAPTYLEFLRSTSDAQGDNLYPFVHLLPDGTLFVFANRDSIALDYGTGRVVRRFPTIPGEPRNYPSAGSSVMLPLRPSTGDDDDNNNINNNNHNIDNDNAFRDVEILVCGGAQYGAFLNASSSFYPPASQSCGRMALSAESPEWEMETMPLRRTMGDMILLPDETVLVINGAQDGCQGWGNARNAALSPVLYRPDAPAGGRFHTMAATAVARVYHSTANLLPDGRMLVAGSNTHQFYTFSGAAPDPFPTELRLEAFLPPYLRPSLDGRRPTLVDAPRALSYAQRFSVSFHIPAALPANHNSSLITLSLISAPFSTHSFSQGQRLLRLQLLGPPQTTAAAAPHLHPPAATSFYLLSAASPPSPTLAPPAYYMLFLVYDGVPCAAAKWIQLHHS